MHQTLAAGTPFPRIVLPRLEGADAPLAGEGWTAVVVYRGRHCPICKRMLTDLAGTLSDWRDEGVSLVAVSGDDAEQARPFIEETGLDPALVAHSLSVAQMRELGLYVSDPRSPEETDHPFAEPGLFVVNPDGNVQIVDVSNAPFARPELGSVLKGIAFVRDNDYPIRGTHAAS